MTGLWKAEIADTIIAAWPPQKRASGERCFIVSGKGLQERQHRITHAPPPLASIAGVSAS
jgi:hypothetical protein